MAQTVTMTLTEFLLARLSEDEEAAKGAAEQSERRSREIRGAGIVIGVWDLMPWQVIDDVAAKRRLAEIHAPSDGRNRWCSHCRGTDDAEYPCPTVRIITEIYSAHPDYDEAWRP